MHFLDQYLESLMAERASSDATVSAYKKDILDYLVSIGEKDPLCCKMQDISTYVNKLAYSKLSNRTIARKISSLNGYYNFLLSEKYVLENPVKYIEKPKFNMGLPQYLSDEEVEKLNSAIDKATPEMLRMKLMLLLLYSSGLRVSELVSIKLNLLPLRTCGTKLENDLLVIKGKGQKERYVILSSSTIDALEKYLEIRLHFISKGSKKQPIFLFPSKSDTGYMTRQNFALLLKNLASEAGLDPSRVSPHKLRHSFATKMLESGADLRVIQEMLGHADISTTQIYTHVATKKLGNLLESKHPMGNNNIRN